MRERLKSADERAREAVVYYGDSVICECCSKLIARGSAVEDWESSAYSCHDCAAGLPEPEFSAEQILARWVSEAEGEADRG